MGLFKGYDANEVKRLSKTADKIISLNNEVEALTDSELKGKTKEFKKRIIEGESLDSILIESFAVVREMIYRVLGKKLYKVQLMGGIALHQGRVAEMKTGEGKTLTEIAPAYLNSLKEEGVHIITVNDYLAKRDKEEMEPVFNALDITVGLVTDQSSGADRKEAYSKDVTYSTNSQLGFDYLRDNIVFSLEDRVQRKLNFVIIDEIDSILIDEARTPLILAATGEVNDSLFLSIDKVVKSLSEDDYKLDLLEHVVTLTEEGIKKAENLLSIDNLANANNSEINHLIKQALIANYLLKIDSDYIIRDGEIILVDKNTGRVAEGRKMCDGLHQAIEAKENVMITSENRTLASITYQNFFKLYEKLSGMSGTVKTEEQEFRELYSLDVVGIPTNKPVARVDFEDKVYVTEKEKLEAIVDDIIETSKTLRPILVATPDVKKSEQLSNILKKREIEHKLLNARTDSKEEADIIAEAGRKGNITIATNIAGRGTDIKISEEVNKLGGLKVIGTERSMSRRIDNQLLGRAGRQGNNGSSQFYISSEDYLILKYVDEQQEKKLKKQIEDNREKALKLIKKFTDKAQNTIENINFGIRKETVKYDDVINKHRKLIYKERNEVLNSKDIRINISIIILNEVVRIVEPILESIDVDDFNELGLIELSDLHNKIYNEILKETGCKLETYPNMFALNDDDKIIDYYTEALINHYNNLAMKYDGDLTDVVGKTLIGVVDNKWIKHIEDMEALRKETNNQSFMQKDPYIMYKIMSGSKFDDLINEIKKSFVNIVFSDLLTSLQG